MIYKNSKWRVFVRIRGFVAGDFVGALLSWITFLTNLITRAHAQGWTKLLYFLGPQENIETFSANKQVNRHWDNVSYVTV
jgi:hypothetical protein